MPLRPRLALVPGEPAGVGPELCLRALHQAPDADWTVIGDPRALHAASAALGLPLPEHVACVAMPGAGAVTAGQPDPANARSVIAALLHAAGGCRSGHYHGMVTGPTHKATIDAAGIPYTGTTELLAADAACEVVMMLARPGLRVALVTTHLPLRAVPDAVTPALLERTLRIVHTALQRDFGIAAPRLAVLGLNPHAGESGVLGREEIDVIQPVLTRLRADGLQLDGPLPADSAFLPERLAEVDALVAMYHDQGLPVLKATGIDHGINITLGLPYPRVAVDHGTALALAGSGRASPASLLAAMRQCHALALRRVQAGAPA